MPQPLVVIAKASFLLQAADASNPAARGPLRRNPGLENAVPAESKGARPTASKTPVRKQLEEALRHYARLQQELVLQQGATAKKDEQVKRAWGLCEPH